MRGTRKTQGVKMNRTQLIDLIEETKLMILDYERNNREQAFVNKLYEDLHAHEQKLKQLDELTGGDDE